MQIRLKRLHGQSKVLTLSGINEHNLSERYHTFGGATEQVYVM